MPNMKSKCLVCTSKDAKYKCPTCYLPFCSVACGKSHKTASCKQESGDSLQSPNQIASKGNCRANGVESAVDGDLLSQHQLRALDDHKEVQCKIRDERLMTILEHIDKASNRETALEKEMRNPEFLEFCDDILEALQVRELAKKP